MCHARWRWTFFRTFFVSFTLNWSRGSLASPVWDPVPTVSVLCGISADEPCAEDERTTRAENVLAVGTAGSAGPMWRPKRWWARQACGVAVWHVRFPAGVRNGASRRVLAKSARIRGASSSVRKCLLLTFQFNPVISLLSFFFGGASFIG
jgi:hypothetical protein